MTENPFLVVWGGGGGGGVGVLCGLSYLKICLQACPFFLSAVFRSLARSLAFSPLPCFVCLFAVTESLAQAKGSFLVVIRFNIFFLIG